MNHQSIKNTFEDYGISCSIFLPLFMWNSSVVMEDIEEEIYCDLDIIKSELSLSDEEVSKIENDGLELMKVIHKNNYLGFLAKFEIHQKNLSKIPYTWLYAKTIEELAEKAIKWKIANRKPH